MQMAAGVNASAEDGGLTQVLALTDVNPLITEKLKAEGVKTFMESTNMWTKAGYETEASEYRDEIEAMKTSRVEGSRLRSAIVLARAVLDRPPSARRTRRSTIGSAPWIRRPRSPSASHGRHATAPSSPCTWTPPIPW